MAKNFNKYYEIRINLKFFKCFKEFCRKHANGANFKWRTEPKT